MTASGRTLVGGGEVQLLVRGEEADVRRDAERFFVEQGWQLLERPDGTLAVERGSRRRTILLGAFAGRRFFHQAVLRIRAGEGTTQLRYRWGVAAGSALGGVVGRRRALRVHEEAAAALEELFERDGRLLTVRRRS